MERRRSHWAWGWEDSFPTAPARQKLAALITGTTGWSLDTEEPVAEADIMLAPSAAAPPFDFASVAADDRVRHTYGRALPDMIRGFRGDFGNAPDAVAFPESARDVVALLDWASSNRVAVIPFGGGTSVVGGVEASFAGDFRGCVSLDMTRMNAVREVDSTSHAARIDAGCTGPELHAQLARDGFTLRHFPQSFEFSTMGGWIATRAGGHYATGSTHIDDFVEAVHVVSPAGSIETKRFPASGAGPDPNRLFIGSEGALGVITSAWVRVQRRPDHRSRQTFEFAEWDDAVAAVRALAQSGLQPANCRLLDSMEAMINQVSMSGKHILLVAFEAAGVETASRLRLAAELCADFRATATEPVHTLPGDDTSDEGKSSTWRDAFFAMPYRQPALLTLGVLADTFETCVTWDRFDAMHALVRERMSSALDEVCGSGIVSCRFTHVYPDGPAPYYTFLGPARRGSEMEQWQALKAAAGEAVTAAGGTITHHHAVGRTHMPWYKRERPDLFAAALAASKQVLDPAGIMNPGVLLP